MDTNRQRFLNSFTTIRTPLASAGGWHLYYCASSFFRFDVQQFKELSPAGISDRKTQVSVPEHAINVQVFNTNNLIVLNIVVSHFMQEIIPDVSYLLMNLCYSKSALYPIGRTFLLAGQSSLCSAKLTHMISIVTRIVDHQSIAVGGKLLDSQINTDRFGCTWEFPLGDTIARKRHEPLIGFRSSDGDSLDLPNYWPGQEEFKPPHTSYIQVLAFEFPATLLQSEGVIAILAFESRESRSSLSAFYTSEEVLESFVQSLYYILKSLTVDLLKPTEFVFQGRKVVNLIVGREGLFSAVVVKDTLFKGKIVEGPTNVDPLNGICLCLFVYLCPVFIRSSHTVVMSTSVSQYIAGLFCSIHYLQLKQSSFLSTLKAFDVGVGIPFLKYVRYILLFATLLSLEQLMAVRSQTDERDLALFQVQVFVGLTLLLSVVLIAPAYFAPHRQGPYAAAWESKQNDSLTKLRKY